MDPFNIPTSITYRRWINPELRDEVDLEGHSDETQSTDTEICTITSPRITQSASSYGATKPEETFTVEDALESIGFGIFQWKMSFITGLSWIADAMEMMILSVLAPQLHCEWRLPSYQTALITSIVFVGMGLSSSVWGNFADKYGRKTSLFVCMSWTLYYGLLSAFTPVYSWLLVLRCLVGLGVGGAPQSVTLYSEFLPAKARGTCIMLIAAFWAIGTMFEVLLALWIMPVLGWRWLLGFSTLPMALFLCFCNWLPESPRFDVLTGKREKAVATLAYIAKQNGKAMPRGQLVAYQQKHRGRLKDLLNPEYCRTTLLLWFIWFANTFCYYGVILLTTEILQAGDLCGAIQGAKIEPSCSLECKYLTTADYKDLLYTTLAEFPGLLLIIFVIEYLGRKKSMAMCFFIFSLFILPLYACIGRTAFTVVIFIARGIIAGGFQVVYVYTPEVFPTENRALAVGIASAMAKVGALITPFVAQVMLRVSVSLTLALYCGCSVLAGVACLMLPIETLGRGLQESSSNQEARSARATVSTVQESQFNENI